MACPAVQTGQRFLEAALTHIDCQAQTIGAYGYGALSDPGSTASIALTSVLVIFVAIFGIRVAAGHQMGGRDLLGDVIRVGIVLTLATSWPAWRTIGYNLAIDGPGEISRTVGLSAQMPGSSGDLVARLQRVDDALAVLNERGSGRRGVATGDWFQLGFARSAFLTGTLGPLAMLRLTTGVLLAIAPLMAGLLLFGITRSIFAGWAKGLVAAFLATIVVSLVLAAELALIEPWLEGVLRLRGANEQALGAPTEVLIVTLAFALICFGAIAFMARIVFNTAMPNIVLATGRPSASREVRDSQVSRSVQTPANNRNGGAHAVAAAVTESINRDVRLGRGGRGAEASGGAPERGTPVQIEKSTHTIVTEALGNTFRRNRRRTSAAGIRRDLAR